MKIKTTRIWVNEVLLCHCYALALYGDYLSNTDVQRRISVLKTVDSRELRRGDSTAPLHLINAPLVCLQSLSLSFVLPLQQLLLEVIASIWGRKASVAYDIQIILIGRLTDTIPPTSRLYSKPIGRRWALVSKLFGTFGLWFLDNYVSNGLLIKDE